MSAFWERCVPAVVGVCPCGCWCVSPRLLVCVPVVVGVCPRGCWYLALEGGGVGGFLVIGWAVSGWGLVLQRIGGLVGSLFSDGVARQNTLPSVVARGVAMRTGFGGVARSCRS
jgi:hypothetical protein